MELVTVWVLRGYNDSWWIGHPRELGKIAPVPIREGQKHL